MKAKRPLVVQLLLSNGAEVDAKGGDEEDTALHIAARNQDAECIAALVSSGSVDLAIKNAEGKFAIEVCESVGTLTTELKKAFEGFDPSMLEPAVQRQQSGSDKSEPIREESREESSDKDRRVDSDGEAERKDKGKGKEKESSLSASPKREPSSKRDVKDRDSDKGSDETTRRRPTLQHRKSRSEGVGEEPLPLVETQKRGSPSTVRASKSSATSIPSATPTPTSVSAGSSRAKIKITSANIDDEKKGSSDSIDSSDDKPVKSVISGVKIQAPRSSTVQSLTPRDSGVAVVRVNLSAPFGIVDEPITLSTTSIKSPGGEVLKGVASEYEVDIMGPNNLDGEITRVHADGSIELKFIPTSAGKYFVQVYLNDIPLFGDYYEVTVKVQEHSDAKKKKK
jgi:hypothetical protein